MPSPVNPAPGCRFAGRCAQCMERCTAEQPELREIEPGHFVACHFADQQKIDENGNYLFDIKTITNQR